jgi:hypothetical protein
MPDVIRSYREFEERFFPATVERRRRERMTPEDVGREIAREALARLTGAPKAETPEGAPDA